MVKSARGRCLLSLKLRSRRFALAPRHGKIHKGSKPKKDKKVMNEWENAICSVCLEPPHNAVLLLCSSHDKGCHPYMCGTSYRFSNCLEQFKKAYTETENAEISPSISNPPFKNKSEITELACPLCRSQVKGWTVVEAAREYLDGKKRSCMQDGCSFRGNYKELRNHVKAAHPSAKPRQVDPELQEKWNALQLERDREDAMSMIRSSVPGATVLGDYVMENDGFHGEDELFNEEGNRLHPGGFGRNWFRFFWCLHTFGHYLDDSFVPWLRSNVQFPNSEEVDNFVTWLRTNLHSPNSSEGEHSLSRPMSPLRPMQSDAVAGGNGFVEEHDGGDDSPASRRSWEDQKAHVVESDA